MTGRAGTGWRWIGVTGWLVTFGLLSARVREWARRRHTPMPAPVADVELHAARVRDVVAAGDRLAVHLQPIIDLTEGTTVGYEALARFDDPDGRGPDWWFAEAHDLGLGADLELVAVRRALELMSSLPSGCYLSINLSPAALELDALTDELRRIDLSDVVLEITEHASVSDYGRLNESLGSLRERGARIAIDDVGAGFANMRHVTELRPSILKLDRSLVSEFYVTDERMALVSSFVGFARSASYTIVAEGVETAEELAALSSLGVTHGQGYLFARPAPPSEVLVVRS